MRKEDLFDAINAMDPQLVEETLALEDKLRLEVAVGIRRKRRITAASAIAACLCLAILLIPIANIIRSRLQGMEPILLLPEPSNSSFYKSLPAPVRFENELAAPTVDVEWNGSTLSLDYVDSYREWFTDAEFSTYESKEENISFTFVNGTDEVHRISSPAMPSRRSTYTEQELKKRAEELISTYSDITLNDMEYSCETITVTEEGNETLPGFDHSELAEAYILEYREKISVGYTTCHVKLEFGTDGSLDMEIFDEDSDILKTYAPEITQDDIYDAVSLLVAEYRAENADMGDVSCSVDDEVTLFLCDRGVRALVKIKLFNENDSKEYLLMVELKKVGLHYNSGSVPVNKQYSITVDEILALIDEMIAIYNESETIKLENFNSFEQTIDGALRIYKDIHVYDYAKYPDEIIPDLNLTYNEIMEIKNRGFVLKTNENIRNGNYSEVTREECFREYECIIAAMLIDRLYSLFPEGEIRPFFGSSSILPFDQYGVGFDHFGVRINVNDERGIVFSIIAWWNDNDPQNPNKILFLLGSGQLADDVITDPFADIRDKLKD